MHGSISRLPHGASRGMGGHLMLPGITSVNVVEKGVCLRWSRITRLRGAPYPVRVPHYCYNDVGFVCPDCVAKFPEKFPELQKPENAERKP